MLVSSMTSHVLIQSYSLLDGLSEYIHMELILNKDISKMQTFASLSGYSNRCVSKFLYNHMFYHSNVSILTIPSENTIHKLCIIT